MEILFVSHKYPPATGGMEKQSFELINNLSKHPQVQIHMLVYRKGEESLLKFFWNLNSNILRTLELHPNIQLIHFNDGLIASLALFHSGYKHLKRVVTLHGLDVVFPLRYFQKKILPRFNEYDHIITVSSATAKAAIRRGISEDKITVIKNGVDHDIAKSRPAPLEQIKHYYPQIDLNKKYMVTLGRPVKRKGFAWLLREVVPQMPSDFQLLMIGPFNQKASFTEKILRLLPKKIFHLITLFLGYPSDESEIRKLLQEPIIDSRVKHLGKVPFQHLQSLLGHASAFLMPNIQVPGDMEGFGLVCLEASVAGTLVLASSLEGITDAVQHQKNGILLPSNDSDRWVDQLNVVLDNTDGYQVLAKSYQAFSLEHYGWEIMASSYLQTFRQLTYKKSSLKLLHSKEC